MMKTIKRRDSNSETQLPFELQNPSCLQIVVHSLFGSPILSWQCIFGPVNISVGELQHERAKRDEAAASQQDAHEHVLFQSILTMQ